jgi:RimJ/RimL family protein N-acetyltransferase
MQVEIRAATLADAGAALTYLNDVRAEKLDTVTRRDPWTLETTSAWLHPIVEGERSFMLLALAVSGVVGMLDVVGGTRDHDRHIGKLGMSVARQCRGKGVGRGLLAAAVQRMKADPSFCRLELECAPWNEPALRLYRNAGFKVEGVRRKGINLRGRREDDFAMALVW